MLDTESPFDTNRRYVRIIERRDDGFVEFGFAIGEPALEVELLMNAPAFEEFCRVNDVVMLGDADAPAWGLHSARTGETPDAHHGDASRHPAIDATTEPTGGANP